MIEKRRIVFLGLVFLTLINLVDGLLTLDLGSLIIAVCLGFLADLERVASERQAPQAEKKENPFGLSDHQTVYVKALTRSLKRIERTRSRWRHDPAGKDGVWFRKYEYDKWTYTLLYNRYEKAKKLYGWDN